MILFEKLIREYSKGVLRGGSGSLSQKVYDLWPEITIKVSGHVIGEPTKVSKDTVFIVCASSEELSRVKMFESQLVLELQKEVSPQINRLYITTGKKDERAQ